MLSLPCPAKINLFLEIRAKRPDGFHELGTLFQAVDAGDVLSAELWDSVELSGAESVTSDPEENLVVRAARLVHARYRDKISGAAGIRFTLDKQLPSGAGLGGGSSDAASALRLANALWKLDLSDETLRTLGAELGSDVPFFLSTATSYGEGRGEILSPAPAPFPFHVVIATPQCHANTAWAYGALTRYREQILGGRFGDSWEGFRRSYAVESSNPDFFTRLFNDFEAPVMAEFAEIRAIRDVLNGFGPVKTMLSGSGASVFSLFRQESDALKAYEAVSPLCRYARKTGFAPLPTLQS